MEVYICIMRGGMISSVSIVDEACAERIARQYRSSGLSVRVFKTREKYEEFCRQDEERYHEKRSENAGGHVWLRCIQYR